MLDKIWLVIERPSPAEEPQVLGGTNDEDYADRVITALRSLETEASYWKEAVDFLML